MVRGAIFVGILSYYGPSTHARSGGASYANMDYRSLWIGIEFLEGATLREKLGFVVRNRVLAILNRCMDGVGHARVEHVYGTSVTSPSSGRG